MKKQNNKTEQAIQGHSAAKNEKDTYEKIPREEKEQITGAEIQKHWETRAQRRGVQAVMSARHRLHENRQATKQLQEDIFSFLGPLLTGKRIFELGVGIGRMTKEIAKRAQSVVGNDISASMLKKARRRLQGYKNVDLRLGKIYEMDFPEKSFDLVFDSIVLLHILSPVELEKTVQAMQNLSNTIFLVEHTYEGENYPISKYSILRRQEEYHQLFLPYELIKQKTHLCVGDTFTFFLFKAP